MSPAAGQTHPEVAVPENMGTDLPDGSLPQAAMRRLRNSPFLLSLVG